MENFEEILICKSFSGSFGESDEQNIPHEIINYFTSDNGKNYLFIPPYGGYGDTHKNITYIIFTDRVRNNKCKVKLVFKTKNAKRLHMGGSTYDPVKHDIELKDLHNKIHSKNIKYGGHYLDDIKMANEDHDDRAWPVTLELEDSSIYKPKVDTYLCFRKNVKDNCKTIILSGDKHFSRQKIYFSSSPTQNKNLLDDYNKLNKWINGSDLVNIALDKLELPNDSYFGKESYYDFLKLIRKENEEQIYTNILYEYLHIEGILELFCKKVLQLNNIQSKPKIDRECLTKDKLGRMDLCIKLNEDSGIVIENKIKSGLNAYNPNEHKSQLSIYKEEFSDSKVYVLLPDYVDIELNDEAFTTKIKYSKIRDFFNSEQVRKHISLNNKLLEKYYDTFIAMLEAQSLDWSKKIEQRFFDAIKNNKTVSIDK